MWKIISQILTTSKIILLLGLCFVSGCVKPKPAPLPTFAPAHETESVTHSEDVQSDAPKEDINNEAENSCLFKNEPIPKDIREKMQDVTISDDSLVTFDDLSYLTITYYGYDDEYHTGNLIVDKELADEVISIFEELLDAKFPIEKMNLPCEYDGIDELSMRDNNTSAFNDRPVDGTNSLSYHQLGRAIDINPLVNPYIRFSDDKVLPTTARKYLNRSLAEKGMINDGDNCVKIFKKYGWTWGGDWNSVKDYQHFEKR